MDALIAYAASSAKSGIAYAYVDVGSHNDWPGSSL